MSPIYVIGDSHASFFSGSDAMLPAWPEAVGDGRPEFRAYRLGPVLAYTLATKHVDKFRAALATVPANSTVMLAFGEIDCRIHLAKRWLLYDMDPDALVETCIARYLEAAQLVTAAGHRLAFWAVPPAVVVKTPGWSLGHPRERTTLAFLFNSRLMNLGYRVLSIFDDLLAPDDALGNPIYYDADGVHLTQAAMPFALAALPRSFDV